MRLRTLVYDDFLPAAHEVRELLLMTPYVDHVSKWDGITYPGINLDIPPQLTAYITEQLTHAAAAPISVTAIFARLTARNLPPAPNKIHCDTGMGQFAALIYMSADWPEGAGTSFWSHETEGSEQTPSTDITLTQSHTNDLPRWQRTSLVQGKFNRALIYDARLWHCAEPIGGWGTTPATGRLVLTCFFSLRDT